MSGQNGSSMRMSDRRQADRRIAEEWSTGPYGEERRHTERRSGIERRVMGERRAEALEATMGALPFSDPIPSAVAINGHPIHPMLVPVPIGLVAGVLLSDIAWLVTRDRAFARSSRLLTASGIVAGLTAALPGLVDFIGRGRIRSFPEAWVHAGGNVLAVGLSAVNLVLRAREPDEVPPASITLSSLTGAIFLLTGWLGGELVYRRGAGLGIAEHGAEESDFET